MIIYDEKGQAIGEIWEPHTQPKEGKTIALVIGHDQHSKGAYGNMGMSEWHFNDKFIADLKTGGFLPEHHIYYVYYRSVDISGYTAKMNDLHARIDKDEVDISIEFHFNGATDASVNGNEVLYCSENGRIIASFLDEALDALSNRDRGIKKVTMNDNGGGFCCRGKSVAILTEPFFGSHQNLYVQNGHDRELLKQCYKNFFNSI